LLKYLVFPITVADMKIGDITIEQLVDFAIQCSDYPIIRQTLQEIKIDNLLRVRKSDMVDEIDSTMGKEMLEFALKDSLQFEGLAKTRDRLAKTYHNIASRVDERIQNFREKYPIVYVLVEEKTTVLMEEVREIQNRLTFMMRYGNPKQLGDGYSYPESDEWTPYAENIAYIWDKFGVEDDDDDREQPPTAKRHKTD
jgi:hypothetical protein